MSPPASCVRCEGEGDLPAAAESDPAVPAAPAAAPGPRLAADPAGGKASRDRQHPRRTREAAGRLDGVQIHRRPPGASGRPRCPEEGTRRPQGDPHDPREVDPEAGKGPRGAVRGPPEEDPDRARRTAGGLSYSVSGLIFRNVENTARAYTIFNPPPTNNGTERLRADTRAPDENGPMDCARFRAVFVAAFAAVLSSRPTIPARYAWRVGTSIWDRAIRARYAPRAGRNPGTIGTAIRRRLDGRREGEAQEGSESS